jgi:hypothetical protein
MPKWPLIFIILIPAVIKMIAQWMDDTVETRHINRMADASRRKAIRMRRTQWIN